MAKKGQQLGRNIQCRICGTSRYLYPYYLKKFKGEFYCSWKCRSKGFGSSEVSCDTCGKIVFKKAVHLRKNSFNFCTRKCLHIWMKGKHWSPETEFKLDGESKMSENRRARGLQEYKKWRTAVYTRDAYTCKHCGIIGGKLHAHHIVDFSKDKKRRYDIDNGITLCVSCHKKTDSYPISLRKL